MPFIQNTPESLLARSDSKNPASTCRGLTSNGISCRRALSKSPQPSPSSSPQRTPFQVGYCWQHKDQAVPLGGTTPQEPRIATIQERTSIDTLVDRLGILKVETERRERRQRRKPVAVPKAEKVPQKVEGHAHRTERHPARSQSKSNSVSFCCFGGADDGKRAPRPVRNNGRNTTATKPAPKSRMPSNIHVRETLQRPSIVRDPSSRELLSFIPTSTTPQTMAQLLAELAKPVSENDKEGYIYMFWLTPESLSEPPPSEAVSSLLAPSSRPIPGQRRTSDVLNSFASDVPNTPDKKTVLLKIGRAENVQRRLNQWTRQCGYNVSLLRYYPYYPSTRSETSVDEIIRTPMKIPNVHKVERLIHIELNGQRAIGSGKCKTCGREHKEWFEVTATGAGVRAVDGVVRRWIEWAKGNAGQ